MVSPTHLHGLAGWGGVGWDFVLRRGVGSGGVASNQQPACKSESATHSFDVNV